MPISQNMNSAGLVSANASLGTDKIGVWGLRPQRVQGRALAFLPKTRAYIRDPMTTAPTP